MIPHSPHVHSLIPSPALPFGLSRREPQHEQVWVEYFSLTSSNHTPASSHLYLSRVLNAVQPASNTDFAWCVIRFFQHTSEFILEASRLCEKIFGFGITGDNQKIMNFYKNSWVLGDKFGFVCFGGQRRTMMFVLNGTGCLNAKMGWERRLNIFLNTVAVRPTLTRVDLAHDDFEGKYITVDWAEAQWHERTLSCGARDPNIERRGNWHRPSGKGRTLYIGCRDSGKFTRFYEKGKKEGDKESSWCRAEVELKSSDRVIPFDILLTPFMAIESG